MRNKYGYEIDELGRTIHRLVYIQAHGSIAPGWVIHHINEIKGDNRLDNLIALPARIHDLLHGFQRKHRRRLGRRDIESFMKSNRSVFALDQNVKNKKPKKPGPSKKVKKAKIVASPQEIILLKEMARKWPSLFRTNKYPLKNGT